MSGTNTQCQVLANMIERGISAVNNVYREFFRTNPNLNPQTSEPVENWGFSPFFLAPCYNLNAIGYAILGLEGNCYEIVHNYREQLMRAQCTHSPKARQPYIACADMLGLPIELLWDTEFFASKRNDFDDVINELRKPQRGYC